MKNDLEPINKRLANLDGKLVNMDKRLTNRLDGVDERLSSMDNRLDGVDKRLDSMDNRISNLQINDIKIQSKLGDIGETIKLLPKLYNSVDKMISEVLSYRQEKVSLKNKLDNHEKRISKIELNTTFAK
ncbi:MAG: hypothetical protein ABIJ82_01605 [Patescibacteria group bacterium]